jgi:hypothetical protein
MQSQTGWVPYFRGILSFAHISAYLDVKPRLSKNPSTALICGVLWWLWMRKISRNKGEALPALQGGKSGRKIYS